MAVHTGRGWGSIVSNTRTWCGRIQFSSVTESSASTSTNHEYALRGVYSCTRPDAFFSGPSTLLLSTAQHCSAPQHSARTQLNQPIRDPQHPSENVAHPTAKCCKNLTEVVPPPLSFCRSVAAPCYGLELTKPWSNLIAPYELAVLLQCRDNVIAVA